MAGKNAQLMGRCSSCIHWSSAQNEARALYALERYTNPNADYNECLRRAKESLSLDMLDPTKADERGWCKAATELDRDDPLLIAVHLNSNSLADLITRKDFGCIHHKPLPMPGTKHDPGIHPIFAFRRPIEGLGDSAPIGEIVLSYLPQGTALDPSNAMSPLHDDHPMNPKNPWNLAYNLVPAHVAWRQNSDLMSRLSSPSSYGETDVELDDHSLPKAKAHRRFREQKMPTRYRG